MNSDKLSVKETEGNWYAIAVKPGDEYLMEKKLLKIAQTFEINLDTFIPVNSPKSKIKPLLPGVILLSVQEGELDRLIETPGVKGYYNNLKSKISVEDLNYFKNNIEKKTTTDIAIGQMLVINKGTFSSLIFKVESIENGNLSGFINLFGRDTLVTIPKDDLI
jgi:transcription antitermination factor NusG